MADIAAARVCCTVHSCVIVQVAKLTEKNEEKESFLRFPNANFGTSVIFCMLNFLPSVMVLN